MTWARDSPHLRHGPRKTSADTTPRSGMSLQKRCMQPCPTPRDKKMAQEEAPIPAWASAGTAYLLISRSPKGPTSGNEATHPLSFLPLPSPDTTSAASQCSRRHPLLSRPCRPRRWTGRRRGREPFSPV
ncbi:hypothetical protein BD309DRAFT_193420 [Dichomitus squalens]|nr:hypothetical protein BD309DRAFT_193420 [Dichomitus squalens]